MNPTLILALVFGALSLKKFLKNKAIEDGLILSFWVLLGLKASTSLVFLLLPAVLCLAGSFILRMRKPNRELQKLEETMKKAGYSDKDLQELEDRYQKKAGESQSKSHDAMQESLLKAQKKKEFGVRPNPSRLKFPITLSSSTACQTDDNGKLQFPSGHHEVEIEIKGKETVEDGVDLIKLETFTTDQNGDIWSARSFMDPGIFLDDFTDDKECSYQAWETLPLIEQSPIRDKCQIAGVRTLLDSRSYSEIEVDGKQFTYFEKYQSPQIDLGWDERQGQWSVRVSKLFLDLREIELESDDELIPAFVLSKEGQIASPVAAPENHFFSLDDLWEEPEDRQNKILFRRTGDRRERVGETHYIHASD